MGLLRDAGVVAAAEARRDVEAGARVPRHLDQDAVAKLETRAGNEPLPVEALHGEILADEAGRDGVSLALERLDVLEGKETQRALGTAVVSPVALRVALEAELG